MPAKVWWWYGWLNGYWRICQMTRVLLLSPTVMNSTNKLRMDSKMPVINQFVPKAEIIFFRCCQKLNLIWFVPLSINSVLQDRRNLLFPQKRRNFEESAHRNSIWLHLPKNCQKVSRLKAIYLSLLMNVIVHKVVYSIRPWKKLWVMMSCSSVLPVLHCWNNKRVNLHREKTLAIIFIHINLMRQLRIRWFSTYVMKLAK